MAFSSNLLLFCSLLLFITPSIALKSSKPKALLLPVTKDSSTLQYLTQINQRTPLVPLKLTLDLGGRFFWVDCLQGYVSSSYKPALCHSAQCHLAESKACFKSCFPSPRPGCNNDTCVLLPDNTISNTNTVGELATDIVSIQSTDGKNPGRVVSVPQLIFTCAPTFLLKGLASGVKGMAGLGRTEISLPSQFSSAFSFDKKFAICLSSSPRANGVVFFGDGPYFFLPRPNDFSKSLIHTPLILNPANTAGASSVGMSSADYFIGVNAINVNGNTVPLNTSLLSINKNNGVGGTKISTVIPYTVMETTIYKAVTQAFVKEVANIPRVTPVAPFGACFNSTFIGGTRVGPAVPQIDLVLQSKSVIWGIFGANSMVQVKNDVLCLGFVDGGLNPRTSIVIGGYQLEDNLLQFDLNTSRLGFTSSLLFSQTTCSNFNFTSNA